MISPRLNDGNQWLQEVPMSNFSKQNALIALTTHIGMIITIKILIVGAKMGQFAFRSRKTMCYFVHIVLWLIILILPQHNIPKSKKYF